MISSRSLNLLPEVLQDLFEKVCVCVVGGVGGVGWGGEPRLLF